MAFPLAHKSEPIFLDRYDAGIQLAVKLLKYRTEPDVVVLALPRGGVPVAYEIATALSAPLDVFIVRKLGMPEHPEFAIGAIATGGVQVLHDDVIRTYGIPRSAIQRVIEMERRELERREDAYRQQPPMALRGKTVILVDDGLATGASMRAAVQSVRARQPKRVVVAVPVGAPDTCRDFADISDEVVCAQTPEDFSAVGQWYQHFGQTSDEEVRTLLENARHHRSEHRPV